MISHRIKMFNEFVVTFVTYALYIREVIFSLLSLIVLAGYVFSQAEGIKPSNGIYFAFITALSVGYGDITPHTAIGSFVSVGIGLMGIFFVGITAAVANRALADTAKRYLHRDK
jgi:voltage-gated potassium channel